MVQQSGLVYSLVARKGNVVLADYSAFSGNFAQVARQFLEKTQQQLQPQAVKGDTRFTYPLDGHTFNFLTDEDFTYMVMADESFGRQIPFSFLDRVQEDFRKRCGTKAKTAAANSLEKEFGPRLKDHMEYCVAHPEEMEKVAKIKQQVSDVKSVMLENVEKVLDRGEKFEVLIDKSDNLKSQAATFVKSGRQLRRKFWVENLKTKGVVISIIVVLILIIWLSICHGFICH
eukprot:TRINITY_DN4249_c0_g1_i1.p1 TRINITY_DN4249_c0_g1~~TRINITY_DN4249_c0_g1_i1.p1  ORF type:complete len:230 (+),score=58.73 TRINITY_DN4249_c0_g1_i1:123-812(+)